MVARTRLRTVRGARLRESKKFSGDLENYPIRVLNALLLNWKTNTLGIESEKERIRSNGERKEVTDVFTFSVRLFLCLGPPPSPTLPSKSVCCRCASELHSLCTERWIFFDVTIYHQHSFYLRPETAVQCAQEDFRSSRDICVRCDDNPGFWGVNEVNTMHAPSRCCAHGLFTCVLNSRPERFQLLRTPRRGTGSYRSSKSPTPYWRVCHSRKRIHGTDD